jgi:TetR/AcrR family transcriptional regulator, regulator of cefoperazone and chloramphenicol sensitivity
MLGEEMANRANELQKKAVYRRLLAAAGEEFAQHGFAGARVRVIADAAHVNLAAVNYYFGDKEGLYRATLSFLANRPQAADPLPSRRSRGSEDRLHRRIYQLLDKFVGCAGPSIMGRILAHEAIDPTSHIENLIEDTLRPELDYVFATVREIAGPRVPELEVMHTAIGVLGQCLLYQFAKPAMQRLYPSMPEGVELCKSLARHITDITVAGAQALAAKHEINLQAIDSKEKQRSTA